MSRPDKGPAQARGTPRFVMIDRERLNPKTEKLQADGTRVSPLAVEVRAACATDENAVRRHLWEKPSQD
jgi:hypothetical protein